MSKKRAVIETLAISAIIPVIWFLLFRIRYYLLIHHRILCVLIILIPLAYSYVVFYRHKELGAGFVVLTAVAGTVLHALILYSLIQFVNVGFSSHEGHPDGFGVLVLMFLIFEPFLINIVPVVLWILKKIIWLFKPDE